MALAREILITLAQLGAVGSVALLLSRYQRRHPYDPRIVPLFLLMTAVTIPALAAIGFWAHPR